MARKNNKSTSSYNVYYEKRTGEILAVSNETISGYDHMLTVSFEEAEHFISGEWLFKDYLVGYKRLADEETAMAIMPKVDDEYGFRNDVYEWITLTKKNADVEVEWDGPNSQWVFSLCGNAANSYDTGISAPKLTFFVTLESDFNFLIRTIILDSQEFISQGSVSIPFCSKFEKDIDKISIGTRLIFKSYKLKVTHE